MPVAPGVYVSSRAQVPPRSAPTDTGMTFMLGLTEKGPDVPTAVGSFQDYEETFGVRTGFADLYDAVEAYYQEGGAKLTIQRVGGTVAQARGGKRKRSSSDSDDEPQVEGLDLPAPRTPPADLPAALDLLTRDLGPGQVVVPGALGTAAGASATSTADTTSGAPDLTNVAPTTGWADGMTVTGPGIPAGTTIISGAGTATMVMSQNATATAAGVTINGSAAGGAHGDLLAHAAANNRIALLDPPALTQDAAGLTTLAGTLSGAPEARYGALFAPTALVPAYAIGSGQRAIPFSAIAAGLIARSDGAGNSPNVPAAGDNGLSRFALDLGYLYTDAERGDLNDAGVDIARLIYGGVELYGYRTLATEDTGWQLLNNARLNMAIVAQAEAIGEHYVFRQIDGRKLTISQFGGDLTAMMLGYYEQGSVFGATADDAFYVDVGDSVNTPSTIAAGELHAVIACRMSPFAERVYIEIVKTATETSLALAA